MYRGNDGQYYQYCGSQTAVMKLVYFPTGTVWISRNILGVETGRMTITKGQLIGLVASHD